MMCVPKQSRSSTKRMLKRACTEKALNHVHDGHGSELPPCMLVESCVPLCRREAQKKATGNTSGTPARTNTSNVSVKG